MAKGQPSSQLDFATHFNPQLALHSSYFGALDQMLKCVERNASVSIEKQETVCAKEFKTLRL
jgi:hypothetical protein